MMVSTKGSGQLGGIGGGIASIGLRQGEIDAIERLRGAEEIRLMIGKLRLFRCRRVEALHESREQLDRFDYLLYRLERELPSNGGAPGSAAK